MAASTPCAKAEYPRAKGLMRVQSSILYFSSSPRRNKAASAGESVNALNAEMAMANAIVKANCLYRMPVVPGKNDTGTNTEIKTRDVAITALVTSPMASDVALWGSQCSNDMWRCTFSITTIASSTTSPVASVMPKSVSELIENPKILMNANVPINDTGIVMAGITVARQSSKNRKMTMITMMIASLSVEITSVTESPITVVVSNATTYLIPGGKDFDNSRSAALAALSTSSALALDSCCTPMPIASCPLYSRFVS